MRLRISVVGAIRRDHGPLTVRVRIPKVTAAEGIPVDDAFVLGEEPAILERVPRASSVVVAIPWCGPIKPVRWEHRSTTKPASVSRMETGFEDVLQK